MSKLDELRKNLQGTFIDAFGNSDGADELFDAIVKATEQRIIKLLEDNYPGRLAGAIALIKGEQK